MFICCRFLLFLCCCQALAVGAQVLTRGPVLHVVTDTAITIRWRTDLPTTSKVSYGPSHLGINQELSDSALLLEHELRLTGLSPNTRYVYHVGNHNGVLAADKYMYFTTAPEPGVAKPTRVWVIGDAGTGSSRQKRVRDAYLTYPGSAETDLFITVGDNAYANGSEAEFQAYHFNIYQNLLKHAPHAPAFGNHDSYTGTGNNHPFFQLFSFPTQGEAGGVPSGQKAYYSFNYGHIHFITLDSYESSTASGSPMLTWLAADLAANTLPWTIVYFHHAPYSRGSHDSDTDAWMSNMRRDVLPILDAYGVDLVLAGHSHTYERSGLVNGHYGLSSTYLPSMSLNNTSGRDDLGLAYSKGHYGRQANSGAVYVVAGTSGQNTARTGYHPANLVSSLDSGSLVLDINGERLDAVFLTDQGTIADYFTIKKGSVSGNRPAAVSITGLPSPAIAYLGQNLQLSASSSASTTQVQYLQQGSLLGSSTTAPDWAVNNIPVSNDLLLSALATTVAGIKSYSAPVAVKTYPMLAPLPPELLLGAVESSPSAAVKLMFSLGSRYISGVALYRATVSATGTGSTQANPQYTLLAQLESNSVGFDDRSVQLGERYLYRLTVSNSFGQSNSAPLSVTVPVAGQVHTSVLIPHHSVWKYWDKGGDLGAAWRLSAFDDSSWPQGQAELGYGDGGEQTTLAYGGDSSNKHITSYLRKNFTVDDVMGSELILSLRADDGAIVYLNGQEATRVRMPLNTGAALTATTLATAAADDGDAWVRLSLPMSYVVAGNNLIAVELHQTTASSSDISFDLSLMSGYGS
ncbi:MAG: hypothetical protein RLZZ502_693, partial [Pseudomonadota bacterium]